MDNAAPLTDPASVLVGLGALCGLGAALYWSKVARSVDTSGQVVKGPDKRDLRTAASLTSIALALASFGYLFGRFTGAF